MNRRSFLKKCLGTIGVAAGSSLVIPWFKLKPKLKPFAKNINGELGYKDVRYSSASILIDDNMPLGCVDMVNLKLLNFQKSLNKEIARSLYGP